MFYTFQPRYANSSLSVCERLKQEADDQHKAEERARRDAILQQYLQRKAQQQQEETVGGSSGQPTHHISRRQKAMRAARPKSQPPPAARSTASLLDRSQNTKDDLCATPDLHGDYSQAETGNICSKLFFKFSSVFPSE